MQRAAAGLAATCGQVLRERRGRVTGSRVVLLVGAGNNGGDALWAGARLARGEPGWWRSWRHRPCMPKGSRRCGRRVDACCGRTTYPTVGSGESARRTWSSTGWSASAGHRGCVIRRLVW